MRTILGGACLVAVIFGLADPGRAQVRTWTDKTGTYSVEAEFRELEGDSVQLRLKDGNVVEVPLAKLSDKDRQYIASLQRDPMPGGDPRLMQDCLVLLTFDPPQLDPVDNPATALDASGQDNSGRISSATTTTGPVGIALEFDGRDDYVELESLYEAITRQRRELSISLWIRRSSPKLAMVFDAGFYADSVTMTVQDDQARFVVSPRVGGVVLPFTLPTDGQWHHVVMVWTGSSQIAYVDGRRVAAEKTKAGTLTAETLGGEPTVFLGTQVKEDRRGSRYFQGAIDEFAVFARALAPEQIAMLHRQGTAHQSLAALVPAEPAAAPSAGSPDPAPRPSASPAELKLAVKKLHAIPAHERSVGHIRFSGDGALLASSSYREAKVWKVADRSVVGRFEATDFNVVSMTFMPGDRQLLVSADGLEAWDFAADEVSDHADTDAFLVMGLDYCANGALLMAIDGRQIKVWEEDEPLDALEYDGVVKVADLSPDGALVAAAMDGRLVVRESGSGEQHFAAAAPEKNARSVAFSGDGRRLAVSSNEPEILLYDVAGGKPSGKLQGHTSSVFDVEFIAGTSLLASSGGSREGRQDRTARIWDAATRKQLAVLDLGETYAQCLAVSPDGRLLALGCQDGSIQLWQLAE